MATDPLEFLKALALRGANRDFIPVTSRQLADETGVSQQTASRKILELLERDLIDRRLGARVQLIKITDGGMDTLRGIYEDYRTIFEDPQELVFHGRAETGLGEGKKFVQKPGYLEQFADRLGFKPYPGTFNVRVDESEQASITLLKKEPGIEIEPFRNGGNSFGGAKCFPALVQAQECAVVLPERSRYDQVLELISPAHLRSELSIDDGDPVEVHVQLEDESDASL